MSCDRRRLIFTLTVLVIAGTACGSSTKPEPTTITAPPTQTAPANPNELAPGETRLTTAQASVLSTVATKNNKAGGARFVAVAPYGPAATFTITGDVDWRNVAGSAVLNVKRSDGVAVPPQNIAWGQGLSFQEIAGLEAAMSKRGRPGITHTARPLDPNAAPLDRVVVLINSMAQARPENPILLRQNPGVAFAGTDTIDGVTVEKLRFKSVTFSVDPEGVLRRVSAIFSGFIGPVVVDFTDRGPKTIALPTKDKVVDAASIVDVLQSLQGATVATK